MVHRSKKAPVSKLLPKNVPLTFNAAGVDDSPVIRRHHLGVAHPFNEGLIAG